MFPVPVAEPSADCSVWHAAAETSVKRDASAAGSGAGAGAGAVVSAGRRLPAACAAAGAGPGLSGRGAFRGDLGLVK